jgi:hypothetical protein
MGSARGARRSEVMFTNLVEVLVADVFGVVSHARDDLLHGRHPLMVPRAVPLDKVIARPRHRSPQAPEAKGRPHAHRHIRSYLVDHPPSRKPIRLRQLFGWPLSLGRRGLRIVPRPVPPTTPVSHHWSRSQSLSLSLLSGSRERSRSSGSRQTSEPTDVFRLLASWSVSFGRVSRQDRMLPRQSGRVGEDLESLRSDHDDAGSTSLGGLSVVVALERDLSPVGERVTNSCRCQEVLECRSKVVGTQCLLIGSHLSATRDAQYSLVRRIPLGLKEHAHLRIRLHVANRQRPVRCAEPDLVALVDEVEEG